MKDEVRARLHADRERVLCGRCGRGVVATRLLCGPDRWGIFLEPGLVEISPGEYDMTQRGHDQQARGQRPGLRRKPMNYAARSTYVDGRLVTSLEPVGRAELPLDKPELPFRRTCPICGVTAIVSADVLY